MSGLFRFIRGRLEIHGDKAEILRLVNLLTEYNVPFSSLREKGGGELVFDTPCRFQGRISDICETFSVKAEMGVRGLPRLFYLYRKRTGLFIGAAVGVLLVLISNLFVWKIEIVGNEKIPDGEVLAFLEKYGLYEGAYKKSPDLKLIAINAELEIDGLAWLSVNYSGTLARAELREAVEKPDIYENDTPTNLVAKCDGEIIYTEAVSGVCAVKRGDVVKKGELLIGGVVDSKAFGYKLQRSRGKITAKTYRTFEVSVPYLTKEKEYTGKKVRQTGIKIFGKTLVLGKSESPFLLCDVTQEESDAVLFSRIRLPFSVHRTVMREYTEKEKLLSRDEALDKARRLMGETLSTELAGAEILSQSEKAKYEKSEAVLTVYCECIEDICTEELIDIGGIN